MIDELVDSALAFWPSTPPHDWTPDDVRGAYQAALALGPRR
jgi:hypothetical protein